MTQTSNQARFDALSARFENMASALEHATPGDKELKVGMLLLAATDLWTYAHLLDEASTRALSEDQPEAEAGSDDHGPQQAFVVITDITPLLGIMSRDVNASTPFTGAPTGDPLDLLVGKVAEPTKCFVPDLPDLVDALQRGESPDTASQAPAQATDAPSQSENPSETDDSGDFGEPQFLDIAGAFIAVEPGKSIAETLGFAATCCLDEAEAALTHAENIWFDREPPTEEASEKVPATSSSQTA